MEHAHNGACIKWIIPVEINENSIVNGLLWTLRRELDRNGDVKINVPAVKP